MYLPLPRAVTCHSAAALLMGKHGGRKGVNMNVVYAATRNLYGPLGVTIKSLLEHNKPEMIYILAEDDTLPFEITSPHKIINVSRQTHFKPGGPNWGSPFTYMAMMRLLYVVLLPVDKVLQLDVDTIVCEDLTPLWNVDLTGKWCAAVPEYMANYKPFQTQYFNVGVCLFNLKKLREDHVVPLMVEELNLCRYLCIEQDMLNKYGVPLQRILALPVRYNDSFCCGRTENPAVVHFAGYPDWFTNKNMPRREYLDQWISSTTHHAGNG